MHIIHIAQEDAVAQDAAPQEHVLHDAAPQEHALHDAAPQEDALAQDNTFLSKKTSRTTSTDPIILEVFLLKKVLSCASACS